jgi:Contractile injection system tube protein
MAPLEKAVITKLRPPDPNKIFVMFNPEEYTLSKDINYARIGVPGLNSPVLQFVHGNLQTLDMELFLDTYEAKVDVRQFTKRITDLLSVDPQLHAPPVLLFTWSSLTFTCVLAKVSQQFVMFLPNGTPVRARLKVTFNEFQDPELQAMAQKNQTADYTKVHVVLQRETLSAIAANAYENPALWRPIAVVNGIDDPRRLETGRRLVIPKLPFRDPDTGEVVE